MEHGDVVAALIATTEELANGVEAEAAWIIPSRPFFPEKREVDAGANGKDPNAVVQPRIDKFSIVSKLAHWAKSEPAGLIGRRRMVNAAEDFKHPERASCAFEIQSQETERELRGTSVWQLRIDVVNGGGLGYDIPSHLTAVPPAIQEVFTFSES